MHKSPPKFFVFLDKYNNEIFKNKNINIGIIYRKYKDRSRENQLIKIARACKQNRYQLFVSNDLKLAHKVKADGIYISAYNKNLKIAHLRNLNFRIIGSAHNIKEINIKKLQGCSSIIFSRLFKTSYKYKKGFLGVIKFNLFSLSRKENLVPLGGIKLSNLNKLSTVKCKSIALSSEKVKKPITFSKRCF